jgi:hypothetical protein
VTAENFFHRDIVVLPDRSIAVYLGFNPGDGHYVMCAGGEVRTRQLRHATIEEITGLIQQKYFAVVPDSTAAS